MNHAYDMGALDEERLRSKIRKTIFSQDVEKDELTNKPLRTELIDENALHIFPTYVFTLSGQRLLWADNIYIYLLIIL